MWMENGRVHDAILERTDGKEDGDHGGQNGMRVENLGEQVAVEGGRGLCVVDRLEA